MTDVVIVEDHLLIAEALRSSLHADGVTATVLRPDARSRLLETLARSGARLVLLDLDLGEFGDSTAVIAPLVDRGVRVLVVSGTDDRRRMGAALEAGAVGYYAKADGVDGLLRKVRAALTSAAPLDADLRRTLRAEAEAEQRARSAVLTPFDGLTERESATLLALTRGQSVHEIAVQWVVSEATVRSHVRAVLAKLGVTSQLAAVAAALRSGWLTDRAA